MKRAELRGRRTEARGRRSENGQAAIEFIVGILLFMLLVAGIVHINRMARTSLFLHAVLRGDAGERAMAGGALSVTPAYISDWEAGADSIRYTADDQPIRNSLIPSIIINQLTRHSVKQSGDWMFVAIDSRLPVSMIHLNTSPLPVTTLGFVHAEETLHVPVDTVLRQLVYDKDEVAIKEEVWMPLMGGLY